MQLKKSIEVGRVIALEAMREAWADCEQCSVAQQLTCDACVTRYTALLAQKQAARQRLLQAVKRTGRRMKQR